MVCTFFGHADTPDEAQRTLHSSLVDLIENKNVDLFYVGNNGNFDSIVRNELETLSKTYPIKYFVVLAYMPKYDSMIKNTILPEGIESHPPRFAIAFRNRWMIKKSDYVITYVTRSFGGAYKFKTLSVTKNKTVIEISTDSPFSA